MRLPIVFSKARPARIADASKSNPHNGLAFRVAAYCAAIALIACGASQNVAHGFALGSARSEVAGYILAGGALAAAVMSPICLAVALTGRGLAVRFAALFLGLWCLAFGLSNSLGFIATAKDAGISERQLVEDAGADRRARFAAAAAELARLTDQKPTRAILERRRELERTMRETAAPIAAKTVGASDPQAAVLSTYLQALGWQATPEAVSRWTTAFAVGFYEIAGAFSLAVARGAAASPPAPAAPAPAPDAPAPKEARPRPRQPRPRDDDSDPPAPPPPRKRGRRPTVAPSDAVAAIKRAGGKVNGSLADIGRAIGTKSKTTAHRVLHGLAAQGLIRLASGPAGMTVALT